MRELEQGKKLGKQNRRVRGGSRNLQLFAVDMEENASHGVLQYAPRKWFSDLRLDKNSLVNDKKVLRRSAQSPDLQKSHTRVDEIRIFNSKSRHFS